MLNETPDIRQYDRGDELKITLTNGVNLEGVIVEADGDETTLIQTAGHNTSSKAIGGMKSKTASTFRYCISIRRSVNQTASHRRPLFSARSTQTGIMTDPRKM